MHCLAADFVGFGERPEPGALDDAEVDAYIVAIFAADEAETLGIVKSLDGAERTAGHEPLLELDQWFWPALRGPLCVRASALNQFFLAMRLLGKRRKKGYGFEMIKRGRRA